MALSFITEKIVFGLVDPKPLRFRQSAGRSGFPKGKARIRLRNREFAKVFIKTPEGVRQFAIKEEGGFWLPFIEQTRNLRHV